LDPACQPYLPSLVRSRVGLQLDGICLRPIFYGLIRKPCAPIREVWPDASRSSLHALP
jgi:hypothetical protein